MFNAQRFNRFRFNGPRLLFGPPPPPAGDLKQAVVAALLADTALAAIVGTSIYPDNIPQTSVGPAIAYSFLGSDHVTSLAGASGLRRVLMQLELQAPLESQIEQISEIIRNRLQGLIGPLSGLAISFVTYDAEVDGYDEPLPGSDLGTHYKQVDYLFVLREKVPTALLASTGSAGDLKQAIVATLSADTDIAALIGTNCYPDNIPQTNVGPAIAYSFLGIDRAMQLSGAAGLRRSRLQLELQAPIESQLEALSELIRLGLQGLIGPLSGLPISFVTFDTQVDGYYEPLPGSDAGTHFKEVEYTFVLRESIPTLS